MASFLSGSRLNPTLQIPDWSGQGAVVVPELMAEGVGAVIAESVRRLPLGITWEADVGVFWQCQVQLPDAIDPQHPDGFLWARRLLEVDLIGLLSRMGLNLRPASPGLIDAVALRKGSWMTLEPTGWLALIGLTGSPWSEEWGGRVSTGLTLLPPGHRLEVPVLTRHVEALLLRCPLEKR
jgi:hypothetical protein